MTENHEDGKKKHTSINDRPLANNIADGKLKVGTDGCDVGSSEEWKE